MTLFCVAVSHGYIYLYVCFFFWEDFITIGAIFYSVVFSARLNLNDLRTAGWIFDMGSAAHEPWYKFYTYFDFGKVRYSVLWSTLPTQFALCVIRIFLKKPSFC